MLPVGGGRFLLQNGNLLQFVGGNAVNLEEEKFVLPFLFFLFFLKNARVCAG